MRELYRKFTSSGSVHSNNFYVHFLTLPNHRLQVRLTFSMNPDPPDEDSSAEHLPYAVKIVNLGMEDRTGPYPLVRA